MSAHIKMVIQTKTKSAVQRSEPIRERVRMYEKRYSEVVEQLDTYLRSEALMPAAHNEGRKSKIEKISSRPK